MDRLKRLSKTKKQLAVELEPSSKLSFPPNTAYTPHYKREVHNNK